MRNRYKGFGCGSDHDPNKRKYKNGAGLTISGGTEI